MSKRCLAGMAFATCLALSGQAFAQTDATNGTAGVTEPNATNGTGGGTARAPSAEEQERRRAPLNFQGQEYSVGWRFWVMGVPRFIVTLFAHVEQPWGGALNVATGPEFVYRNRGFEISVAGMYTGYGADGGFFRGTNEGPTSTELVKSDLWGLYLTSHFLWGIKFHPMFEFQAGVGLGLGFIGGNLYRTQAYQGAGGAFQECPGPSTQPDYCANPNNGHYPGVVSGGPNGGRYVEPNWFGGGYVPVVIPWFSLPHLALHIRPHRNFDFRVEGGFALIGFYGGLSAHYVF
jgi:hypothetical protein